MNDSFKVGHYIQCINTPKGFEKSFKIGKHYLIVSKKTSDFNDEMGYIIKELYGDTSYVMDRDIEKYFIIKNELAESERKPDPITITFTYSQSDSATVEGISRALSNALSSIKIQSSIQSKPLTGGKHQVVEPLDEVLAAIPEGKTVNIKFQELSNRSYIPKTYSMNQWSKELGKNNSSAASLSNNDGRNGSSSCYSG